MIGETRGMMTGLALAASLAGVLACAADNEFRARKLDADETAKLASLLDEAEKAFSQRHEEASLRRAIELFGAAVKLDPVNARALTRLAKAHYDLAYAFFEGEDDDAKEKRKAVYHKSREYGMRALKTNARFAAAMESGAKYEAAVQLIQKDEKDLVEAVGMTASAWGRWGELMGVLKVAMDIPKVKAFVDRVLVLDQTNNYGGPHRFLGAYYIKIPKFAGQSPKKSKRHFLKAIEIAPEFLENRLLYAEYYATYADDQALFKEELQKVVNAPDENNAPYRLENQVAKKRAAEMLKNIDKYF